MFIPYTVRFLLISIFMVTWSFAQTATTEEVLLQYQEALMRLSSASYTVQRIDTFASGDVRNHRGSCTLIKQAEDALGFYFYGKRLDVHEESLYDGVHALLINHKKSKYFMEQADWSFLGSPGGQMVVKELMRTPKNYTSKELYQDDSSGDFFILRFNYPDQEEYGISAHSKLIYLQKSNFLPYKIIKRSIILGKRRVTIKIIANLTLNDSLAENKIHIKDYLKEYKLIPQKQENHLEDLLNETAADFYLMSFDNQSIHLSSIKDKIVLLYFWEVWCRPCLQSLKKIQELHEQYADKGLVIIGIVSDRPSFESAKQLIKNREISFINTMGNLKIQEDYKVLAVPQYVLLNASKKIIYAKNGYEKSIESILKDFF